MATTPCHAPADHGDDDGDHGGGDEDNKDKDDAGIMHLPAHTFKKGCSQV